MSLVTCHPCCYFVATSGRDLVADPLVRFLETVLQLSVSLLGARLDAVLCGLGGAFGFINLFVELG